MTTVNISTVLNDASFVDSTGAPLSGGQIWQYQAGSNSIQQTTYNTSAGNVANTNPIVLDSIGRSSPIWLVQGQSYHLVLEDSLGNVLTSFDNITGTIPSSGGISFPLKRTNYDNATADEVSWMEGTPDAPSIGDTRIRGTFSGPGYNGTWMKADAWFDDGFTGAQWNTAWEVLPINPDFCCGGNGNIYTHIPYLQVDNISGITYVASIVGIQGITTSANSGVVTVSPKVPAVSVVSSTSITTTPVRLLTGNGIYCDNPNQTFKFIVNGICTAGSSSRTVTFVLTWGFNATYAGDTHIATFNFVGDTGSAIPFRLELDMITPSGSVQNTSASLNNQGTTGISTQPWTGGFSTGSYSTIAGFLNLWCLTNDAGCSVVAKQVIFESVI